MYKGSTMKLDRHCLKKVEGSQMLAHTYNPGYMGPWDGESHSSKPAPWKWQEDSTSTNSWTWWCVPDITHYVGGWDQKVHASRPAQAKSLWDLISMENSSAWWHMPILPAKWEVKKVRPSHYVHAGLGQKWDPISTVTRTMVRIRLRLIDSEKLVLVWSS
jgi:hypothetical protein